MTAPAPAAALGGPSALPSTPASNAAPGNKARDAAPGTFARELEQAQGVADPNAAPAHGARSGVDADPATRAATDSSETERGRRPGSRKTRKHELALQRWPGPQPSAQVAAAGRDGDPAAAGPVGRRDDPLEAKAAESRPAAVTPVQALPMQAQTAAQTAADTVALAASAARSPAAGPPGGEAGNPIDDPASGPGPATISAHRDRPRMALAQGLPGSRLPPASVGPADAAADAAAAPQRDRLDASLAAAPTAAVAAPHDPSHPSGSPAVAPESNPNVGAGQAKARSLSAWAAEMTPAAQGPSALSQAHRDEPAATAAPAPSAPTLPAFAAELARVGQTLAPPGSAANAARAATELQLSTPVAASDFVPRLCGELAVLARNGVQEARVHVNPAELGPIAVQITLDGSTAQVHLAVDSAQTRELLEQAMPTLAAALRENGLTLTGGGVFQQSRHNLREPGDTDAPSRPQDRPDIGRGADDAPLGADSLRRSRHRGVLDTYA